MEGGVGGGVGQWREGSKDGVGQLEVGRGPSTMHRAPKGSAAGLCVTKEKQPQQGRLNSLLTIKIKLMFASLK